MPVQCGAWARLVIVGLVSICGACRSAVVNALPTDVGLVAPIKTGTTASHTTLKSVDCGLERSFVHRTRYDGDRRIYYGDDALVFRSRYAVNTDGAPTSYHPDDPAGRTGLAINTICNGASAYTASGKKVDYRQCGRLIELFRQARKSGWQRRPGRPYLRFYGVATSDRHHHVPCVRSKGPYAGYFVSTTKYTRPGFKDACDPRQYLDALRIPFIIVPRHRSFSAAGMNVGDLAIIADRAGNEKVLAMVGDLGPSWGLGEGSIAVAVALGSKRDTNLTRAALAHLAKGEWLTLVLTKAQVAQDVSEESIRAQARQALASFGGAKRLAACAQVFDR